MFKSSHLDIINLSENSGDIILNYFVPSPHRNTPHLFRRSKKQQIGIIVFIGARRKSLELWCLEKLSCEFIFEFTHFCACCAIFQTYQLYR